MHQSSYRVEADTPYVSFKFMKQGMTAETTPPFGVAQKPWGGHPSCVQAR